MCNAWSAYDGTSTGYLYHGKHGAEDLPDARRECISHAAYRLLKERYAFSRGGAATLAMLDQLMMSLGYDPNILSLDTSSPAGLGNLIASQVSAYFIEDGARQTFAYKDLPNGMGGYAPINPPLATYSPSGVFVNVDRWQPLAITNALYRNGFPVGPIQVFQGAQWFQVRPFALNRQVVSQTWIDPGPPPRLLSTPNRQIKDEIVGDIELTRLSALYWPSAKYRRKNPEINQGNSAFGCPREVGTRRRAFAGR